MAPSTRTRRTKRQQSTLTQLDFETTPHSTPRSATSIVKSSAGTAWTEGGRPYKRQRRDEHNGTGAKRRIDNTLTQIGFLIPNAALEWNSDIEVVADSQPNSAAASVAASPSRSESCAADEALSTWSSPRLDATRCFKIPVTPRHRHILEARSSQTPPSIILSPARNSKQLQPVPVSPLKARSVNFKLSPVRRHTRQIKRTTTVEDSQYDEPAMLDILSEEDDSEGGTITHTAQDTQTVYEQSTFDPAASALDRDAARCRWTQLVQNKSFEPGDDDPASSPVAAELPDKLVSRTQSAPRHEQGSQRLSRSPSPGRSPGHQPSQMSTILPTQSSPRQIPSSIEEITPLAPKHATATLRTLPLSSSPLPAPPWTESERAGWLQSNDAPDLVRDYSLADFSLPPPPPIDWSNISSSLRAKEN